mmetsp:Transcript_63506/g.200857  ORF Transcript_63506/g.200857 Transcript_63506/m.200857 type:complete len:153 (+) Transcript_63506:188-646(+)
MDMGSRDASEVQAKIAEYERFVQERLKVDLQRTVEARAVIEEEMREYADLATNVKMLQEEKVGRLRSRVDLGSQVFCEAEVPDTSMIYVKVGLGFMVECTLDEALRIAALRESVLEEQRAAKLAAEASIRAHIKLVLEGVRELMNLPPERGR